MDYEKRTSLEERLLSYENYSQKHPSAAALALAGFHRDLRAPEPDAVECRFCGKALVDWTDDEVPVREHFAHAPSCLLFNIQSRAKREETFAYGVHPFSKNAVLELTAGGLCLYNLTQHSSDMFCYFCGFFYSVPNDANRFMFHRILEIHRTEYSCQRQTPAGREAFRPGSPIFFFRLLAGEVLTEEGAAILCHHPVAGKKTVIREERRIVLSQLGCRFGQARPSVAVTSSQQTALPERPPPSPAGQLEAPAAVPDDSVPGDLAPFLSEEEQQLSLKESLYIGLERITGYLKEVIDQSIKTTKEEVNEVEAERE